MAVHNVRHNLLDKRLYSRLGNEEIWTQVAPRDEQELEILMARMK
jgi:hypothetical protein